MKGALSATAFLWAAISCAASGEAAQPGERPIGRLSTNPFASGAAGQEFHPDSIANPHGRYGSPFSPRSATNRHATDAPILRDSAGTYRGKLSANPNDPDSVSNPYGRYGSRFSPDSINNPYGAGNPYAPESPHNPFGRGLEIFGKD